MPSNSTLPTTPLISVIIPCYNHEDYIQEAIDSVLAQTIADFELLVLDDCSTDKSYALIEAYDDPRLRHSRNAENLGAPATINKGINEAQGKYITILNSDDVFDRDRFSHLYDTLSIGETDILGTDIRLINDNSEEIVDSSHWWLDWFCRLKNVYQQNQNISLALLTGNIFITTSNLVFQRDLFAELGPFKDYRYTHDYDWLLNALAMNKRIKLDLSDASVSYRLHDHNTIRENPLKANQETFALLTSYMPTLLQRGDSALLTALSQHLQLIEGYIEQEYRNTDQQQKSHIDNLEKQHDGLVRHRDELTIHRDELIIHRDELIICRDELISDRNKILASRAYRTGHMLMLPLHKAKEILLKLGTRRPSHEVADMASLQTLILPWLDQTSLFSFDIFDTLFERHIDPPEYIHEVVAEHFFGLLSDEDSSHLQVSDILAKRRQVETQLREEAIQRGEDHECHFDLLFDGWVGSVLGEANPVLIEQLKAKELELEIAVLYPKPGTIELLQFLKQQGKRIVATSDMYLGQKQLTAILQDKGILGLLDKVLVSSELGVAKYSGRLFHYLMDEFQCPAKEIIHIGDNIVSDVISPQKLGIKAVFLNDKSALKRRFLLRYSNRLALQKPYWRGHHLYQIALSEGKEKRANKDFFYDYGFSVLGLIFSNFCQELIKLLAEHKTDKILFMARDGYLPMQLFELFLQSPVFANLDLPPHDYINISRKVTFNASLAQGLSHQKACVALYDPMQKGLHSVLTTFGLPIDDFRQLASKHGFEDIEERLGDWRDKRFFSFLQDPQVQEKIIAYGQSSKQLLQDYLTQFGYFDCKKVALVDIGWNGTIQFGLDELFSSNPKSPHILGYYFGYCAAIPYQFSEKSEIFGVFYDERRKNAAERLTIAFEEIFEEAARSDEASTISYKKAPTNKTAQRIVACFKSSASPSRQQELSFQPKIDAMQEGITDFAKIYLKVLALTSYRCEDIKPFALTLLERSLSMPNSTEVKHLSTLKHADDFGRDSTMEFGDIRTGSLALLKPRSFKRKLLASNWRYAYLSDVLFGVVAKLYRILDLYRSKT